MSLTYRNIVWWIFFLPAALAVQMAVPGLDALMIGAVILLQEKSFKELVLTLPLLVLIQEGIGSREFGGAILWYAIIIVFFFIGYWLFEVQNVIFIILLSAALGFGYLGMVCLMAPLQYLPVDMPVAIDQSIIQSLFIPPAWGVAFFSRRWLYDDEA